MEKKPTGSGGGPLLDAEGNVACMTFQGDQTGNEECLAASVIRANLASIPAE
jgi:hypothetical protein